MSIISQAQEYRVALVLLFVGTIAGFLVGRLSILDTIASNPTPEPKEAPPPPVVPTKEKEKAIVAAPNTTSSDWEDEGQGELSDFSGMNEECKLVLVVRTDLGMTKGKLEILKPPNEMGLSGSW
jgi:peptidyl-tRNA hydrolase, PTH2 family